MHILQKLVRPSVETIAIWTKCPNGHVLHTIMLPSDSEVLDSSGLFRYDEIDYGCTPLLHDAPRVCGKLETNEKLIILDFRERR